MKLFDINKLFTDKVSEYIAKGYTINVTSMNSTQGEIGKVDLIKGEEFIRIWMNRESFYGHSWNGYELVFYVSRWLHPASHCSSDITVWNNDLETIEYSVFYEIERDKWYIDNLEEALTIQSKRYSRYDERYYKEIQLEGEFYKEIACKYLKRKQGYKRVSYDKISVYKTSITGNTHYLISYNGNTYKLY